MKRLLLAVILAVILNVVNAYGEDLGWWHFNETEGSQAKDSSSYNTPGAIVGSDYKWVKGIFDGALFLDSNSYLTMDCPKDGHLDFDAGQNFTITLLVKGERMQPGFGGYGLVSKKTGMSTDSGFDLSYNGGNLRYEIADVSGAREAFYIKGLADGWHYIAFGRSGEVMFVRIYTLSNGKVQMVEDTKTKTAGSLANNQDFRVNISGWPSFKITLDELRVRDEDARGSLQSEAEQCFGIRH
ncbi:MAG: hypothetical protein PHI59_02975 [Candidatus Omnitrophica bacterium]|nr:hypothetical protein [Candidatus Omnitrophota bacterium]